MKKEALFYIRNENGTIGCTLCPHNCTLKEGQSGICRVRQVEDETLKSLNFGEVSSFALDPVEKKPLFHFRPGKFVLSVGSFGCNFKCGFCQNYNISKNVPETICMSSENLLRLAKNYVGNGNIGIAFTYNEPTVGYEYIYETAKLIKQDKDSDLNVILVTNGYINKEPLLKILPFVDAMNIDLKSFNNSFYKDVCGGDIESVKNTIKIANEKCHVEIATLLVNGYNDSTHEVEELSKWLCSINPDIPLHLSRYYPSYKFTAPPTPIERILSCKDIAKKYLKYVYIGNAAGVDNNTYCPECGKLLVKRDGYSAKPLIETNVCPECGHKINIVI